MEDDLIVVNDLDPNIASTHAAQAATGRHRAATPRVRRQSLPSFSNSGDVTPCATHAFLGPYDRELDSDEEELSFEKQFILYCACRQERTAENYARWWLLTKFRLMFGSSSKIRAGLSSISGTTCIQQNLSIFLVSPKRRRLSTTSACSRPRTSVRKPRFRRRVNRGTTESVEQEVERLLEQDALADDVKYDVLDNVNPDLSDSECIEPDDALEPQMPGAHFEHDDTRMPGGVADGDIDKELAEELDRELEGDDDDGDESEDEDEEDEDEDDETQLPERFAVRKEAEVASTGNPLIRKRFEDALKKLRANLEVKTSQNDERIEMARLRRAAPEPEEDAVDEEDSCPPPLGIEILAVVLNGADGAQLPPPDGDLFGPDNEMDVE
ncbi:hypothetical protein BJY52DRAFT_1223036 [Lactarius psammicola]|nr:hypothetical protein BJY52DRAFT_1223036 [Lactarius psammicola]